MNQLQFESEFIMEAQFHVAGITDEEIYLIVEQASYMSDYERGIFFTALTKMMKSYH